MRSRITINLNAEGELEIWLNPAGRDLLVKELQTLSESWDHFHIAPEGMGDLDVSSVAYRPSDTLLEWGKVLLRPDDWDAQHFPHVLEKPAHKEP